MGGIGVDAARRGVLIHRLLERLPELPAERRIDAAMRWLERQAADLAEETRAEMAQAAIRVLMDPACAEMFAPEALAAPRLVLLAAPCASGEEQRQQQRDGVAEAAIEAQEGFPGQARQHPGCPGQVLDQTHTKCWQQA